MKILGIETSCDETAAAVVLDGSNILSSVVASQDDLHAAFRGVVPEIASRAHLERMNLIAAEAIERAGCRFDDLDAIAAVNTPGLIGSLLIGFTAAKTFAWVLGSVVVAETVALLICPAQALPFIVTVGLSGLLPLIAGRWLFPSAYRRSGPAAPSRPT